MTTQSDSVEQTEAIAAELAQSLRAGDFVALDGELGAGKTQFVRGLVIGLGGNPRAVSSPTYILLNVYPAGKMTVYHLDAFRITSPADLEAIGFSELLQQGQVVVVEWAGRRHVPLARAADRDQNGGLIGKLQENCDPTYRTNITRRVYQFQRRCIYRSFGENAL